MYAIQRETLDGLRAEWSDLLQRSSANTVFSTWEWQNTWRESFDEEDQTHLLSFREGSRLVGIVPLIVHDGGLALAGGLDVSDYLDIIAEVGKEAEVLTGLLDYLETMSWNSLDLYFLRHDSPTLAILPKLAEEKGLTVSQQTEDVCPFVNLPSSWEAFVSALSKKDRHELRRKMRRLEGEDGMRWVVVPSNEASDGDMDTFVQLCRLSSKEKAYFMDTRMERFFRSVVDQLRSLNLVRLYFLELQGQRVSTALCFDQGQELWLYNSGYDPDYSSLSVGLLLKAHCIRDAITKGKSRFDFLRGRERYKYDLGGTDVPVTRLRVSPR